MSNVKTVIDVVVRHEKEIQELKRLVTPMMEFNSQIPTKLVGPNLVGILNAAGFYKKKDWVGLKAEEIHNTEGYKETREMYDFARLIEAKLKDRNT